MHSKKNTTGDIYYYSSEIIRKHEGFHYTAYYDHTRRSIGYGTKSYKGETITYDEGFNRFKKAIKDRVDVVQNDHPKLLAYEQGALVSLLYNCPSCYMRTLQNGISREDFTRLAMIGTKYENGLRKRANNEWVLFTEGVIY